MDKNYQIVGIVKAQNSDEKNKKKKAAAPTQFWKALVKLWFDVYAELLPKDKDGDPAKPCFDSIEAFQYKIIIRELKKRAEEKKIEWTEKIAIERTKSFLLRAWDDNFISKNYMLRILSNNKSKIFNNQITPKNNAGNFNSKGTGKIPDPKIKPSGDFGQL